MIAGDGVPAYQQFLVQLFPRPQAHDLDLDVAVGAVRVFLGQARHLDHGAGQVDDFDRFAHVQYEDFAAAGHGAGLDDELRCLGDQHEVAGDVGMGDGDGAAALDLVAEQRHDRSGRAQHVAEAHHAEYGAVVGPQGESLEDQFGAALAGAHDVRRAHGLVGGDQDAGLDIVLGGGHGHGPGAQHVVAYAGGHVVFHQRHVLVGGGMVDGVDAVFAHDAADQFGVAHAAHVGRQLGGGEALAQFMLDGIQRVFGMVQQDEVGGFLRLDLAAEFAAYRAAGARDQDRLARDAFGEQVAPWRNGLAAQQVLDLDFADGAFQHLAFHHFRHGGQGADGNAQAGQAADDGAPAFGRCRGNGQDDLLDLVLAHDVVEPAHRIDAQAAHVPVGQPFVVVEEADGRVGVAGAHGDSQLEAGLAGAVDGDTGRHDVLAQRRAQQMARAEAGNDDVGKGDEPVDQQRAARWRRHVEQHAPDIGADGEYGQADARGAQHGNIHVAHHVAIQAAQVENGNGCQRHDDGRADAVSLQDDRIAQPQVESRDQAGGQGDGVRDHHDRDFLRSGKGKKKVA